MQTQNSIDFFKVAALISPLFSAAFAGAVTYHFGLRAKKNETFLQNRIDESKAIVARLIDLRVYCYGRIAYFSGNEISPFWEENSKALLHRSNVSAVVELNTFYLSFQSQKCLQNLVGNLSVLCSLELNRAELENMSSTEGAYFQMVEEIDNCIRIVKKDL